MARDRRTRAERTFDHRYPYAPRTLNDWLHRERTDIAARMTGTDYQVIRWISDRADHDRGDHAYVSARKCAQDIGRNRATVRRSLTHLQSDKIGLIEQTGTRKTRGGEIFVFRLLKPAANRAHSASPPWRNVRPLPPWATEGARVRVGSCIGEIVQRNGSLAIATKQRPAWHPLVTDLLADGQIEPVEEAEP